MTDKNVKDSLTDEINEFVDQVDKSLSNTLKSTDEAFEPIRQSAFRRFPTMVLLLTTFGVATTFYAFQRLIAKWDYLSHVQINKRPLVIYFTTRILKITNSTVERYGER